ncbi:MAG: hydroxymethylbilane synthase [Bacteroidota bacterium]
MRIGTRGSKLALWQAHFTKDKLEALGIPVELKIIKTKGDKIQHLSFDKIEGKGFFTKEIEDELLGGEIDMAVHSMKDMPTSQPDGLTLTAVSYRENPSDWLLIRKDSATGKGPLKLKAQAVVGTSSARRKAQMLDIRPDISLKDIRGNVPTRINKLREGQFDAILLAAAGIQRLELDLSDLEVFKFDPREMVPAPAQGVLAYQTKVEDLETRKLLQHIHDSEVAELTNIERKVLKLMDGGCHMPLGVYCKKDQLGNYHVWAAKADTWDAKVKRVNISSSTKDGLAEQVFEALKQ